LSKALGVIRKAKAHWLPVCSQLGLHALLGDIETQHGQRGSDPISG
jgi:hypothetical protein